MVRRLLILVPPMLVLALVVMGQDASASLEQITNLLHAKSALMDAVTAGDPKIWDAVLAPNVIYLDESGEVNSRADFLTAAVIAG